VRREALKWHVRDPCVQVIRSVFTRSVYNLAALSA
jgi:hypothetical protein